jgi:hypothetical protein
MEFVYEQETIAKKENFEKIENFEKSLLKKLKDIEKTKDDYKSSLRNKIEDTIKTGKSDGNTIVEKYRIKWKKTYENYHEGYLWYLYTAYMSDSGIEIAPWYFYNVIFHQIAQVVKDNTEEFREIFTKSKDKITIKMYIEDLDIGLYLDYIKNLIPEQKTFDTFFPNWSETPQFYTESIQGLFADMVQKYYGAMIMGCSCPKVRVKGTQEDWDKLYETICELKNIFNKANANSLDLYLNHLIDYLKKIKQTWTKSDTWKKFFWIENCGSGHQESVEGDFRKLINYSEESELLVHQLPNTLCRFPFEYMHNIKQKDSYFIGGIVGSNLDDSGFLVPSYDYAITWIDKEAGLICLEDLVEYSDILEKLNYWERISTSKTYLLHHFNHNSSSYKRTLNFNNYLNKEEQNIISQNDENAIQEYIKNYYEKYLSSWEEFGKYIGNEKLSFEDIEKYFENKIKNGTVEDKILNDENERIKKLSEPDSEYYHLWFEGLNMFEPNNSFSDWNNLKPILTLEQYNKQVNKVDLYCKKLLNREYLKKLIDDIELFNIKLKSNYQVEEIILGTLDPDVTKLFLELLPEKGKKLLKCIFFGILKIPKYFGFEIDLNRYHSNYLGVFNIDDDLKQVLIDLYLKNFISELKEIIGDFNKEIEKEIENYKNEIKKSSNTRMINGYTNQITKLITNRSQLNQLLYTVRIKYEFSIEEKPVITNNCFFCFY